MDYNRILKIFPLITLCIIILYVLKPTFLFKPNGQLREYGFGIGDDGYKKSIFTFQMIIIVILLTVYVFMKK